MPATTIWGIVLGIVALIIAFFLSIRVKIVVSLKNGKFSIHERILFHKGLIYPKVKRKHPNALKETTDPIIESQDPRQIARMIIILKDFFANLFFDLLDKTKVRITRIHISIGTENAATTAIIHSIIVECTAYLIEILDNYSNIDRSSKADIDIRPDFLSQKTLTDIRFVFHLRFVSALFLRFETISTLFQIENIEEILSEAIKNGTIQTK